MLQVNGLNIFQIASIKKNPKLWDIFGYLYNRSAKSKLNKLLNSTDIDLAHLHIYYGSLTGSIFNSFANHSIPVVQSLHEYKLACPVFTMISNGEVCEACEGHNFFKAIPRKCKNGSISRTVAAVAESYVTRWLGAIHSVDHFIAVSEFMKNKMLKYDIGNNQISTVHNFVDPKKFNPSEIEGGYFLYFGRLERLKGLFTLIEASSELRNIPLIIAGSGNAENEIKNIINKRKLDHIKMIGFLNSKKLKKYIRGSICTIIPSEWYENCPMSVLESFAYGKPVIGSMIGGIPELIEGGKDGFLFDVGNSEQLKEKMEWMAFNKKKAAKMGIAGRKKIEYRFNPKEHYNKIIDIYSKVIKAK